MIPSSPVLGVVVVLFLEDGKGVCSNEATSFLATLVENHLRGVYLVYYHEHVN
jgi:hypothetical protein